MKKVEEEEEKGKEEGKEEEEEAERKVAPLSKVAVMKCVRPAS